MLSRVKKIVSTIRQKWIRVLYVIRDAYPVWFYLLNRQARRAYVTHPVALSSVEQRVVADLRTTGIAMVRFEELFPGSTLLQEMQTEFDRRIATAVTNPKKPFLLDPRGETFELNLQDPFFRFATSTQILHSVNAYMGMWSLLHDLVINQTRPLAPGQEKGRSQLWHRDSHDIKVCKAFVYLNDVDEPDGPFCYVRRSHRHGRWWSLYKQRRPSGSYPALEGVEERLPVEDTMSCLGKAGTIIFCDTIGLHKGGYATTGSRKMFTTSFFSSAHTSLRRHYTLPTDFDRYVAALAPETRFALTVPVGTKPRFVW